MEVITFSQTVKEFRIRGSDDPNPSGLAAIGSWSREEAIDIRDGLLDESRRTIVDACYLAASRLALVLVIMMTLRRFL